MDPPGRRKGALPEELAAYDAVLLDLDGCLRVGDRVLPRVPEALGLLRSAGIRVVIVTNDVFQRPEEIAALLRRAGADIHADDVVTAGLALEAHLRREHPGGRAYVVGPQAVHEHVALAGLDRLGTGSRGGTPDVVVVAVHPGFSHAELAAAARAVRDGAALVGLSRDPGYIGEDGLMPGSGAVLAAVETAAGRRGEAVGKPEPSFMRLALDRAAGRNVLVIGDSLDTDLAGARAAGLDAAIVLTGVTDRDAAEAMRIGGAPITAIAASFADLVLGGRS